MKLFDFHFGRKKFIKFITSETGMMTFLFPNVIFFIFFLVKQKNFTLLKKTRDVSYKDL